MTMLATKPNQRLATVVLSWRRFERATTAVEAFGDTPCVYVQSDSRGRPVRVGHAARGLHPHYAPVCQVLDAAMHDSGNSIFVAAVTAELCDLVADCLVLEHGTDLPYNAALPAQDPPCDLIHRGKPPRWRTTF